MAKHVLHKSASRGTADHGWLRSRHTFSFAEYYDPARMHFGALRVLNDDEVAPGMGFGTHPHDNMEIVSIPLEGDLEHRDSMGHTAVIRKGDVQAMSAGTGITHSEYNHNKDRPVKFLQIWIFPDKRDVEPRYDQVTIDEAQLKNNFLQVVSPHAGEPGIWIHQQAWFHLGRLEKEFHAGYRLKLEGNGVYAFVLRGSATIGDQLLEERDGLGTWEADALDIVAGPAGAELLLMEVPMV